MLVQIVSHPRTNHSRLPRAGLRRMADALRRAGAEVHLDTRAFPGTDRASAIADCADLLERRWRERRPEVVLTFGIVATSAAVALDPQVPVVATFDEHPEDTEVERQLAERVTTVLPLSTAERERWRRLGVPTLSAGVFPAPLEVPDPDAGPSVGGDLVTFEDGPILEALIAALPQWGGAGLVLAGRLAPRRWTALRHAAEQVGVSDRVRYHPGLRGARRASMWARAALLVAGSQGARHGGHVLEAAAHGVPAVATAQWAHLDHVIAGTTGILVEPEPRAILGATGSLLADPFQLRALGRAALVRARSAHDPELSGERLRALLEQVTGTSPAGTSPAGTSPTDTGRAGPDHADRADVEQVDRNALALAHLPLARQLAGWYAGRGQSRDELVQVAYLGLVLAAERYDPSHGRPFHSFAVPTILGELRRHFRDHAWAVRIPRSLQETVLQVRQAADGMAPALGHTATPAELAEQLDVTERDVLAALRADSEARHIGSMEHAPGSPLLGERIGSVDPGHDLADVRGDLRAVLRRLPEREQQVLLLRFHGELTQSEIAERLGISQVHVSRVLSRTLATIREHLLDDAPLPLTWLATRAS